MELMKDEETKAVEVKSEQDLHPGCVKRTLTVRDRLLIFQALNGAAAQGADAKSLARLVTLRELLDQDGVDDYYAVTDASYAQRMQEWGEAFKAHVTEKDKVKHPNPGAKPKQAAADLIGHSATYWLKSKLDTHVQDAIRTAKFDGSNAKHVVSLFEKFGIAIEE